MRIFSNKRVTEELPKCYRSHAQLAVVQLYVWYGNGGLEKLATFDQELII